MKTQFKALVAATFAMSVLSSHVGKGDENTKQAQAKNTIALGKYLQQAGTKFDCYFTIELNDKKVLSSESLIVDDPKVTSLDLLASNLQDQFPVLEVVKRKDKTNRMVLHIIDGSLKAIPKYPVAEKVAVNYDGLLSDLPVEVGKSLGGRIRKEATTVVGPLYDDDFTTVKISAVNSTVRDILTDNANTSYRLLWNSFVQRSDNVVKVVVRYPGSASF